jgi:hypothetical protein
MVFWRQPAYDRVLLRLLVVLKRRAQERVGRPFKRGDDFFVVIEAGGPRAAAFLPTATLGRGVST